MRRAQAMFGQAWLIDCHSMPAETEGSARSPDIVIGDRFGASCWPGPRRPCRSPVPGPGLHDGPQHALCRRLCDLAHGQPALGRHALQIEVRRRLYLDEARVEPHDGFLALRRHLSEIATGNLRLYARRGRTGRREPKEKGRVGYRRGQGFREETPIRAAAPKSHVAVSTLHRKKIKTQSRSVRRISAV